MTDRQELAERLDKAINGFAGYSMTHHNIGTELIEAAALAAAMLRATPEPSERLFTQAEVDDAVDRAWQEGHDRGACRCKVTSLLAAVDCPVHSPEYGEPSEAPEGRREPDGWVWRVKRDDGATPTTESGDGD